MSEMSNYDSAASVSSTDLSPNRLIKISNSEFRVIFLGVSLVNQSASLSSVVESTRLILYSLDFQESLVFILSHFASTNY